MNEHSTLPVSGVRELSLPVVFGRLREEIDQLFDAFSRSRPIRDILQMPMMSEFNPAVEFQDCKDHYELVVELPGLDEKDIDIELTDGTLSISGEKRSEDEKREGNYLVSERSYGAFRRQLTLPADVDPENIQAKYRQGILQLDIKKDQDAVNRVRKIAVG
ncbi:MAG: Hsp20/alpha crystallin family protein [Erythrobacter sp.]|nr:MAG: Hsp20/alpha crystallin family protein [Erythrobacter sp.]